MSRARVMGLALVGLLALIIAGAMSDRTRSSDRASATDDSHPSEPEGSAGAEGAAGGSLLDVTSEGGPIELRVWRGDTTGSSLSAYPCEGDGRVAWLTLSYEPGQRDLVRALPPTLLDRCPRVQFRVSEVDRASGHIEGQLLSVLDGEPRAAVKPDAEDVDYVSMDDINIAASDAHGKAAVLPVYRGTTEDELFTAYPCDAHGGIQLLYVHFTPDQHDVVRRLPRSRAEHCEPLRLRLRTRAPDSGVWHATLVSLERSLR